MDDTRPPASPASPVSPASPLGLHRVAEPPGVLPQAAWRLDPSPVIALNRAIALSRWKGPEAGLAALERIERHPALSHYHLLPAALGELSSELGQGDRAAAYYRSALDCVCTEPERRLLLDRLARVAAV